MSRPPKKPALALDTQLVSDNAPLQVLPKVFIGSIHSSFNLDALQDFGITHILNCSRLPSTFPKNFTYLNIDIRDKDDSNILSCIPISNIFIEAGIDNGGILVHCIGGRSRSAAFIAGYLMSTSGYTYDEALSIITTARPVASINRGFEIQLRAYSKNNYDVYMAQQILVRSRIRALHNLRGSKSTIESINASIENMNIKLASKSQRRPSDSEVRILATNSIPKPIVRTFSPIPHDKGTNDMLEDSVQSIDMVGSNGPGSGQKRSWLDTSNVDTSNNINTKSRLNQSNPEDESDRVRNSVRSIRSKPPNLDFNFNESKSNINISNINNVSVNLVHDSSNSASKSRKNSNNSLLGSPSLAKVSNLQHDISSSSLVLPKISSKSNMPNPFDKDNSFLFPISTKSKKDSFRKCSLDLSAMSPKISLNTNTNRSRSLIAIPQSAIDILQSSNSISNLNNHNDTVNGSSNNNALERTLLLSTSNVRKNSQYSLDTNDIISKSPVSTKSSLHGHNSFCTISHGTEGNGMIPELKPMKSTNKSLHHMTEATISNISLVSISSTHNNDSMSYSDMGATDSANGSGDIDMTSPHKPSAMLKNTNRRNSSKGDKDSCGYQSIIREYIPLFDTKTPNIRLSKPGSSAVRVIPPLRGLDRVYCCSWCSTSLFSLANIVRIDMDMVERSNQGGFDILPNNKDTASANKKPIHMPTSTTSKAHGLFMRKMSTDIAAAMIHNHITQLQKIQSNQNSNSNITSNDMNHMNTNISDNMNMLILYEYSNLQRENSSTSFQSDLNDDQSEKHDNFTVHANMNTNLLTKTNSFLPKINVPSTSRAKGMKSFDFDDSNDLSSNNNINSISNTYNSVNIISDKVSSAKNKNKNLTYYTQSNVNTLSSITDLKSGGSGMINDSNNSDVIMNQNNINKLLSLNTNIFYGNSDQNVSTIDTARSEQSSRSSHLESPFSLPLSCKNSTTNASNANRTNSIITLHSNKSSSKTYTNMNSLDSNSYTNSGNHIDIDQSPRIILPPTSSTINHIVYNNERSYSIEKIRWLDRMKLLRDISDCKVKAMIDADEVAYDMALKHEKYIYLEYLEWMGTDCLQANMDVGEICCYNCKKAIGSWTWSPSDRQTMSGKVESPLFRIQRKAVIQSELSLDVTPINTPRAEDTTDTE